MSENSKQQAVSSKQQKQTISQEKLRPNGGDADRTSALHSARWIVIDDLDDCRERNLHNLAVGAFDLDAWRGQRLGCFHAAHHAAHALAIPRHNLNVAFAVKRSQRRQGLGDFHSDGLRWSIKSSDYTLSHHIRKPGEIIRVRSPTVREGYSRIKPSLTVGLLTRNSRNLCRRIGV